PDLHAFPTRRSSDLLFMRQRYDLKPFRRRRREYTSGPTQATIAVRMTPHAIHSCNDIPRARRNGTMTASSTPPSKYPTNALSTITGIVQDFACRAFHATILSIQFIG